MKNGLIGVAIVAVVVLVCGGLLRWLGPDSLLAKIIGVGLALGLAFIYDDIKRNRRRRR